jgi:transposase
MALTYCPHCLEKQQRINELEEELARLKAKLRYQERTATEGAFGSSTPSSKIPIKANTLPQRQERKGGASVGHTGHGRCALTPSQADHVERIPLPDCCPTCGTELESKGTRSRTVTDYEPARIVRKVFLLEQKRCPQCRRTLTASAPGVLPRNALSNRLLSNLALQHYVDGKSLGQIGEHTQIGIGSLISGFHRRARLLKDVPPKLLEAYRKAPVKHADETSWRTDGQNGYCWLFCTERILLFRFRKTRRAEVVTEVMGKTRLAGTLVVDRYAAYNRAPCRIQYCYAHLLRDVEDAEKQFPANGEIRAFVGSLAPLMASSMHLRGLPITDREFRHRAAQIKDRILHVVNHPAQHPAIQNIQSIFRENPHRLYHWAQDRRIPADNNRAERTLRSLVIARKISFGSQSQAGASTREILMTVLHTLKKRTPDPAQALTRTLDQLAQSPEADLHKVLFGSDTS